MIQSNFNEQEQFWWEAQTALNFSSPPLEIFLGNSGVSIVRNPYWGEMLSRQSHKYLLSSAQMVVMA